MNSFIKFFTTCLLLVGIAHAEKPVNLAAGDVGASGHDVVAYFQMNKPVPGQAQFSLKHEGVNYMFSSAENLDAFKASPSKFLPQYGGYCAYAAAFGKKAPADPTQFKVVGGKLYLNYNADVSKKWNADVPGFISKADDAWPKLKDQ